MQRGKIKSLSWLAGVAGDERRMLYNRRMWRVFHRAARITTGSADGRNHPEPVNLATLALAHTGIETAFGAELFGWNVGNQLAHDEEDFYAGSDHTVDGKTYEARFRWFSSELAGVGGYLVKLRDTTRYAGAWAAAVAGASSFLAELRHGGWFVGRSYVHAGETDPRIDTDEELTAACAGLAASVRSDTEDLQPSSRRQAIGAGTVALGAAAGLVTAMLAR